MIKHTIGKDTKEKKEYTHRREKKEGKKSEQEYHNAKDRFDDNRKEKVSYINIDFRLRLK